MQALVLALKSRFKFALALRGKILLALQAVRQISLGHPVARIVVRVEVASPVAQLAGPLVVGVFQLVGTLTDIALADVG